MYVNKLKTIIASAAIAVTGSGCADNSSAIMNVPNNSVSARYFDSARPDYLGDELSLPSRNQLEGLPSPEFPPNTPEHFKRGYEAYTISPIIYALEDGSTVNFMQDMLYYIENDSFLSFLLKYDLTPNEFFQLYTGYNAAFWGVTSKQELQGMIDIGLNTEIAPTIESFNQVCGLAGACFLGRVVLQPDGSPSAISHEFGHAFEYMYIEQSVPEHWEQYSGRFAWEGSDNLIFTYVQSQYLVLSDPITDSSFVIQAMIAKEAWADIVAGTIHASFGNPEFPTGSYLSGIPAESFLHSFMSKLALPENIALRRDFMYSFGTNDINLFVQATGQVIGDDADQFLDLLRTLSIEPSFRFPHIRNLLNDPDFLIIDQKLQASLLFLGMAFAKADDIYPHNVGGKYVVDQRYLNDSSPEELAAIWSGDSPMPVIQKSDFEIIFTEHDITTQPDPVKKEIVMDALLSGDMSRLSGMEREALNIILHEVLYNSDQLEPLASQIARNAAMVFIGERLDDETIFNLTSLGINIEDVILINPNSKTFLYEALNHVFKNVPTNPKYSSSHFFGSGPDTDMVFTVKDLEIDLATVASGKFNVDGDFVFNENYLSVREYRLIVRQLLVVHTLTRFMGVESNLPILREYIPPEYIPLITNRKFVNYLEILNSGSVNLIYPLSNVINGLYQDDLGAILLGLGDLGRINEGSVESIFNAASNLVEMYGALGLGYLSLVQEGGTALEVLPASYFTDCGGLLGILPRNGDTAYDKYLQDLGSVRAKNDYRVVRDAVEFLMINCIKASR